MIRVVPHYASPARKAPRGRAMLLVGVAVIALALLLMFFAVWFDDLPETHRNRWSTVCFWASIGAAWTGLWVVIQGALRLLTR